MSVAVTSDASPIAEVRAFNRFYTRTIGALDAGLAGSRFSLTEARVLYELATAATPANPAASGMSEVSDLRRLLDLDAGYLSRILGRFAADGLIHRAVAPDDARRQLVGLTEAGHAEFAALDRRQADAVRALLAPLAPPGRAELTAAMATVRRVLGGPTAVRVVVLREPRAGDLGWVVSRHGALYAREYGWDTTFEALVAGIVAGFGRAHDPARESGWIAEVDGEPAGSVFCMADEHDPARTARLRLLLVEPSARGLGVGRRLVEECLLFARRAGYHRMTLWTNGALHAARRVYQDAGFSLDDEAVRIAFGGEQVEQNWSRVL